MCSKQRSHCLMGKKKKRKGAVFSKNEMEFSVSSVLQGLEACS